MNWTCMFLDVEMNLEYLERAHAHMGKNMQTPHKQAPVVIQICNPKTIDP